MAASGYSEHDDWLFPIFHRTVTDLSLGLQTGASVGTTRWSPEPQNPTPRVASSSQYQRPLSALFFYVAIVYVPLVDANLLLSAAPLWVPLLLLVFLRQTVARELWISTLVGLVGVGLILHPHLQTLNRGAIYGLVSGILLATAIITVQVLASTEPPARQLFYYALVSTLICFPLLMRHWQTLQVHELLLLCSVGLLLFSQQFFLVQALRYINAGLLSPMSYFTIVFAGIFGWLLWSETPDMRTFLGVALVLFSGVLTVLTGRKQEAAATPAQTS